MYQSRCGICCDHCDGKADVNCTGCRTMKTPFWGGACPVKSCCEGKGLDHCGQCPYFPCGTLVNMGREQGYDSTEKIDQCRRWAQEEAAETVSTMTTLGML